MREDAKQDRRREPIAIPGIDDTLSALRPWMRGFVRKEYGSHVHSDDLLDFEQEGCMAIVHWVTHSRTGFAKFRSIEEYFFYAKAIARNAIRDYDLRYFSRFNISLFKLRRVLKQMAVSEEYVKNPHRQRLGDYMHRLGSEFADRVNGEGGGTREAATMQRRLNLLSYMNNPDITDPERRVILLEVIDEYKREHGIKSPFPRQPLELTPVNNPMGYRVRDKTPMPAPHTRAKLCTNRLCQAPLMPDQCVVNQGFGYCSAECVKNWPPIVNRIQREFDTPIETVLEVSMKLFRSRRRSAEVIGISHGTMSKLVIRFARQMAAGPPVANS